jgi:hypothetical protein
MKNYLESVIRQLKYYKGLGRQTMEQIDEKSLFYEPAGDINSIAIIVKHLHGNMLSRWTNFLHSDGEKAWRNRDGEFEGTLKNREEIYLLWEEGWDCLFNAIEGLEPNDLNEIIYIRNEEHTVMEAINRQLCHYCYHVGQIVYLGKMVSGNHWKSLSISKGESLAYNRSRITPKK